MLESKDGLNYRRDPTGCFIDRDLSCPGVLLVIYQERMEVVQIQSKGEARSQGQQLLNASTSVASPTLVPVS